MFGKEGGSTLRVEDEPEEAARCVQQMRVGAISRLGGCYYSRPSALSGRSRIGGQFPFAPLTRAARTNLDEFLEFICWENVLTAATDEAGARNMLPDVLS